MLQTDFKHESSNLWKIGKFWAPCFPACESWGGDQILKHWNDKAGMYVHHKQIVQIQTK